MFRFPEVKGIIQEFKALTGGKMRCAEICGTHFPAAEAHSDYLAKGGCAKILEGLASASAGADIGSA